MCGEDVIGVAETEMGKGEGERGGSLSRGIGDGEEIGRGER